MNSMAKITRASRAVVKEKLSHRASGMTETHVITQTTTNKDVIEMKTHVLWKVTSAPSRSPDATRMVMSLAATLPKPISLNAMYVGMALRISHSPYIFGPQECRNTGTLTI